MQPYFFPYLGHFALISQVDRWIVFDVTQYTPKTWISRNRVLHPTHGTMYVTVPVAGSSQHILIKEVSVLDLSDTLTSIKGKLSHYRRSAPHYSTVVDLVEEVFTDLTSKSLVHLNVAGLRVICDYLGLAFDFGICSEMDLDLSRVSHPGQWALRISEQIGATDYLNPVSGSPLFRPDEFDESGIGLSFLDMPSMVYDTGPYQFEPNLSILDVLMWNTPEVITRAMASTISIAPPGDSSHV